MRNVFLAKTAVATLLLTLSGVASAAPAYVGKWGTSAADCRSGEPVVVLKSRYLGMPDAECKFTSVSGGKGVWRVLARCQGEGSRPNERITIWATRSRLTLRYLGDNRLWNYQRCS